MDTFIVGRDIDTPLQSLWKGQDQFDKRRTTQSLLDTQAQALETAKQAYTQKQLKNPLELESLRQETANAATQGRSLGALADQQELNARSAREMYDSNMTFQKAEKAQKTNTMLHQLFSQVGTSLVNVPKERRRPVIDNLITKYGGNPQDYADFLGSVSPDDLPKKLQALGDHFGKAAFSAQNKMDLLETGLAGKGEIEQKKIEAANARAAMRAAADVGKSAKGLALPPKDREARLAYLQSLEKTTVNPATGRPWTAEEKERVMTEAAQLAAIMTVSAQNRTGQGTALTTDPDTGKTGLTNKAATPFPTRAQGTEETSAQRAARVRAEIMKRERGQ